jgi:hypothetical protein
MLNDANLSAEYGHTVAIPLSITIHVFYAHITLVILHFSHLRRSDEVTIASTEMIVRLNEKSQNKQYIIIEIV